MEVTDRGPASRWWTPVRILLAVALLTCTLGLVAKAPCAVGDGERWFNETGGAARLCASELPGEYATTGLAEGVEPWSRDGGRWQVNTVSAPVGALQMGAAFLARTVTGGADLDERRAQDAVDVETSEQVREEAVVYTGIVSVALVVLLMVALAALASAAARGDRFQPWPTAPRPVQALLPIAGAPLLAVLVGVGWDLLGVALVALGLAAWTARRSVLAGVLLGLATAAVWWPALVLIALLGTAMLRAVDAVGRAATAAFAVLVAVTLPALVLAGEAGVLGPVRRWIYDDDGVGSLWSALREIGASIDPAVTASVVIGLCAFAVCVGFVLAVRAGDVARTARIAFVLLAFVLAIGPVYAPGYALWLLVPAVLARPVWRDLLVWQAAEIFAVVATWWYVAGTNDGSGGGPDLVYVAAIVLRIAVTAWFATRLFTTGPTLPPSATDARAGARSPQTVR